MSRKLSGWGQRHEQALRSYARAACCRCSDGTRHHRISPHRCGGGPEEPPEHEGDFLVAESLASPLGGQSRGDACYRDSPGFCRARRISAFLVVQRVGAASACNRCIARSGTPGGSFRPRGRRERLCGPSADRTHRVCNVRARSRHYYSDGRKTVLMTRSSATDLAVFESHRAPLVAHAYRMLGDLGRAEDMVQEAWLRWDGRREEVDSPRAYLVTIVTRLCFNELDSARARREENRGDRLPEPLDLDAGGIGRVEMLDQISMAFLVVLQRLTPAERAVLLLRDVFDFDYTTFLSWSARRR